MELERHMMLVLSFHGIGGSSCTIHKALHYSQKDIGFDATMIDWKVIILGMVSALKYLHDHDILHNDIKADNILLDDSSSSYQCVVIDFGKSCFVADGRSYSLSEKERRRYSLEHPQVAPDLRDGHCKQ
jgi:serine/threonine protein kinase